MKIKIIYRETNIEDFENDKVLINMSFKEYMKLREALTSADEESCLNFYNLLNEARNKAEIQWK